MPKYRRVTCQGSTVALFWIKKKVDVAAKGFKHKGCCLTLSKATFIMQCLLI